MQIPYYPLLLAVLMVANTIFASHAKEIVAHSQASLSLAQALQLAQVNFSLDIAKVEIQIQDALTKQAERLPNPILNASLEELPSLMGNTGEINLQWQQEIPVSERITQQVRLRQQKKILAQIALRLQTLNLKKEVTQQYYQVLTSQTYLEQVIALQQTAQSTRQMLQIQQGAGKVLLSEVNRARLLEQEFELQIQNARLQLEQDWQKLSLFWNAKAPVSFLLTEPLISIETPVAMSLPNAEQTQAVQLNHPELRQVEQRVQIQKSNLTWQESLVWQDVKWGIGLRYSPYENNVGSLLGVMIPLPVNNTNQDTIHAAQAQIEQAKKQQQAAQVLFYNRQRQTHLAYQNTVRAIARYRLDILPVAEENLRLSEITFNAGKIPYLSVLDAQRSLSILRLSFIKLWGDYHRQQAELNYYSDSGKFLGAGAISQ